jgi:AAA+ superfamily predicted ATPase
METQNRSIDFLTAKETILKELKISGLLDTPGLKHPEIFPEKNGELKIAFEVKELFPEQILNSIKVLKSYIENLRIHTFEPGYYSFQALNDNIFDPKGILDNIRFRFSVYKDYSKVEISKKGDLYNSEVYAIINLFKHLNASSTKKQVDPKEVLQRLGVTVFDPQDIRAKDQLMSFDHVAGYENVKREIIESIVMPLKNPNVYDEVSKLTRKFPGKNRPRAVLFEGEPGVGKTTMAKIVACLTGIPMVYVPIESILSKYYGESSQNLAYVFDAASLFPSSLMFLDEIDSLAGSREGGMFEATRKLLSVLLRKLDGFEGSPRTITIGATNRKQDLDHALVSRFDKSIYFHLPNPKEIQAILGTYAIHLSETEKTSLAKLMEKKSFSGRSIKDFCDHVERIWATRIIENNLELSSPPFKIYQENLKSGKTVTKVIDHYN